MSRHLRSCAILPTSLLLLLVASTGHAASYSGPVDKAEWTSSAPSYMDMFIAVPDNLPEHPPILVNIHSCGNNAGGQWSYDGFAPLRAAIDTVGFIMILPQQARNCWNVGATESLTHNGGGDTLAIVEMVQYALEKYNGDPTRVYAMGGSGGGMMTQALLAVYPEVFKAGHARAGVPAGCWAEGYQDQPDQWSGTCAGGMVDKTAQAWGDLVRAINPGYTGPRPRVQLNHGDADEVISFNNFGEAIEQWSNVLGLEETPTSSDSDFVGGASTYDRQFWQDECGYTVLEAWRAKGKPHSMGYESVAILEFFGLDQVREQDPWDAACAGMSDPVDDGGGAGGMVGAGGASTGVDDMMGAGASGAMMGAGGSGAGIPPEVGATGPDVVPPEGGATGAQGPTGSGGGATGAGGTGTGQGATGSGVGATGAPGATNAPTPPGTAPAGSSTDAPPSSGAPAASSGTAAPAGSETAPASDSDGGSSGSGCNVVVPAATNGAFPVALLGLGALLRRRRRGSVHS